jgi:hypothetical protein
MLYNYFKLTALLGLLVAMVGCAAPGSQLIGAWELLDEDGVPTGSTKVLSEDHFAFGKQDGGGIWAGGGTWRFVDGFYVETVEYHSAPAVVGKTLKFDFLMKDGLWYHESRFKADGKRYHVDETWRKLEED